MRVGVGVGAKLMPKRWVVVAVTTGALLGACGGASPLDEGAAAGATADSDEQPVEADADAEADAALRVLDPGVDVADEPDDVAAAEFRSGEDGEGLIVRDAVRTDPSGFAQVDWFDGALARVDGDTTYVLTEFLATPGAAVVETELRVGRIWNRLRAEEVERYEVVTDVGTAGVRGTAFWVECRDDVVCTFAVLDGTVVVTLLSGDEVELLAGQQVTAGPEGLRGTVEPTDYDDPWVERNLPLDEAAGFGAVEPEESTVALGEEPTPDEFCEVVASIDLAGAFSNTMTFGEITAGFNRDPETGIQPLPLCSIQVPSESDSYGVALDDIESFESAEEFGTGEVIDGLGQGAVFFSFGMELRVKIDDERSLHLFFARGSADIPVEVFRSGQINVAELLLEFL